MFLVGTSGWHYRDWRERTPGDVCVAVKMSRYLTHVERLRDPAEPAARPAEGAGRAGPVPDQGII
ncbi:DUF72 domain-containing protein [Micromonospora aurantiaca (nom. illeg.)]|uniref:hypothetical protein n=1 Tax=Micromonospora aurantiaca (nom. illeg.) TaxID=47850 RepID=UPI00343DE5EC